MQGRGSVLGWVGACVLAVLVVACGLAPSAAATTTPGAQQTTTAGTPTTAPATSAATTTSTAISDEGVELPATGDDQLDSALSAGGDDRSGPGWAALGRVVLLLGLLVAAGGLTLANYVVVDGADRATLLGWARWAGVPVLVGTIVDVLGQAGGVGGVSESLNDVLSGWFGLAVVLRVVGAVCLLALSRTRSGRGTQLPIGMVVGTGALVLSFAFDGRTVSRGFPPLHGLINIVHVTAASVWAGSLVVLAALLLQRSRSGRRSDVLMLTLRLSGVSTLALGALVIAGVLLSIIVVGSLDDLLDTDWGLTLLLKIAGVAVALDFGTYNRITLLPALQRAPSSARRAAVRNTLVAEAISLMLVVVATAWLVTAAT
jgi:putative copper export protein